VPKFQPDQKVMVINDNFSHIRCKGWLGTVCKDQPHPTLVLVKFPQLDDSVFFAENELERIANKFRVYYINFDYYSQEEFESIEDAVAYGKTKCFEFRVDDPSGNPVCAWSPIGGLRNLDGRPKYF
jgi:hypothetical protein